MIEAKLSRVTTFARTCLQGGMNEHLGQSSGNYDMVARPPQSDMCQGWISWPERVMTTPLSMEATQADNNEATKGGCSCGTADYWHKPRQ